MDEKMYHWFFALQICGKFVLYSVVLCYAVVLYGRVKQNWFEFSLQIPINECHLLPCSLIIQVQACEELHLLLCVQHPLNTSHWHFTAH